MHETLKPETPTFLGTPIDLKCTKPLKPKLQSPNPEPGVGIFWAMAVPDVILEEGSLFFGVSEGFCVGVSGSV